MRLPRGSALAAVGAACLLAGFAAGHWLLPPAPRVPPPVCRPSAPNILAPRHKGPVVLLFGNSQVHDGAWRLGDALAVNCARQGLTAREGLALVPALPETNPDAIFLGFGAVEALRQGAAADAGAFGRDLGALVDLLAERWPRARILLATVSPMRAEALAPASRGGAVVTESLSEAVRAVAAARGIEVLEAAEVLPIDAGGLAPPMTYDGVHLTDAAYALLSAQLVAALERAP